MTEIVSRFSSELSWIWVLILWGEWRVDEEWRAWSRMVAGEDWQKNENRRLGGTDLYWVEVGVWSDLH